MREQLIELAKENGFISERISFLLALLKSNDREKIDYWYYLWMCELQKWLEDTRDLRFPYFCDEINNHAFAIYGYYEKSESLLYESDWHNTKEKALQQVLFEALKLIK